MYQVLSSVQPLNTARIRPRAKSSRVWCGRLESPLLDPLDFLPSPATVGKAAVGVGTKVAGKLAVKAAGASGAKAASTLPLGAIHKLDGSRRPSRRQEARQRRKSPERPCSARGRRCSAQDGSPSQGGCRKIDERLLTWAVEGWTQLVNAAVDWGKSNAVTAKLLVDGNIVSIIVNNPEWALHAELALTVEVEKLGKNKVRVLQGFSERIPCGMATRSA